IQGFDQLKETVQFFSVRAKILVAKTKKPHIVMIPQIFHAIHDDLGFEVTVTLVPPVAEGASGDASFGADHGRHLQTAAMRFVGSRIAREFRTIRRIKYEIADSGIFLQYGKIGIIEFLNRERNLVSREYHVSLPIQER